ncbi:MAG: suppressor of fused domain protein [Anaerolineae bacterium]|jgi:hypothetical protein
MTNETERSESGAPIHRHQADKSTIVPPLATDPQAIEKIEAHIDRYVGATAMVFHELVSDLVHIDVHIVEPTGERPFYTLVTSGMSDQAMNTPQDYAHLNYAELVICLPPSWPLSQDDFQETENYWPLRGLKFLARLPHVYNTWLWATHTVPNGDPPEPFASNTRLCCMLLARPVLFDDAFMELKVSDEKTIHFLSLLPIYREEMDFKLKYGVDELFSRLDEIGVSELLDVNRKNVCEPTQKS